MRKPSPMDLKLYHAIPNIVLAMPLENRPKILLLSPYLNYFRFELSDKTFFFDCVLACVHRRSRCERGRTRQRAVLRASERGPVPRPRTRRTVPRSRFPGRLRRRQVQFHPLMHASVLVFMNTTYWPVLINCICFACWKHSWIATPWFVITIPWPPRLMSECVLFGR